MNVLECGHLVLFVVMYNILEEYAASILTLKMMAACSIYSPIILSGSLQSGRESGERHISSHHDTVWQGFLSTGFLQYFVTLICIMILHNVDFHETAFMHLLNV
jgi:hypothetical protein